jgi:DNA-binding CsgD family transcriptional regulator
MFDLSAWVLRLRAGDPGATKALTDHLTEKFCHANNKRTWGPLFEGINAALNDLADNDVPPERFERYIKWKMRNAVSDHSRAIGKKVRVPRSTKSDRRKKGKEPYHDLDQQTSTLFDSKGHKTGCALHVGGKTPPRNNSDSKLRESLELSDVEQEVLALSEDGYTDHEIATTLGVNVKAIKEQLKERALQYALRATDEEISILKLSRAGYTAERIGEALGVQDVARVLRSLSERALRFGYKL